MSDNPFDNYMDTRTRAASCVAGCGWVELKHQMAFPDDLGQSLPAAGTRFRLLTPYGQSRYGTLDENGCAALESTGTGTVSVEYEPFIVREKKAILEHIKKTLDELIDVERKETADIIKKLENQPTLYTAADYSMAYGRGLWRGLVGIVQFAGELVWGAAKGLYHASQYLNPLTAPETFKKDLAALKQSYKELKQFKDEDLETYMILYNDPETWNVFYNFSKDYIDAQHSLEWTESGGETAFAIVLVIVTAGVGSAVAAGSGGARLAQLGNKLSGSIEHLVEILKRFRARKIIKDKSNRLIESKTENKHQKGEAKKALPVKMKKHKPPCFKPSDKLKKSFKDNPKKMEKEFYRQLKDQEAGINKMSAGRYLKNRQLLNDLTKEHGHDTARRILTGSGKAQYAARKDLTNTIEKSVVRSLRKQGIKGSKAEQIATVKAKEQLKQLAALHDPDLIAGGQDKISRVGNKNVNSSLGSQWAKESRVKEMDRAAKSAIQKHGPDVKMNVQLDRCKN